MNSDSDSDSDIDKDERIKLLAEICDIQGATIDMLTDMPRTIDPRIIVAAAIQDLKLNE